MRHCQAVGVALLAGLLAGCFGARPEPTTARFAAPGPFAGAAGADVVQLDVFLIERPAGDDFLNRKLWELADEQAVSLESKPTPEDNGFRVRQNLEDNGFRVGQIGGLLPSALQAMLGSNIACPDPRHVFLHDGHVLPMPLGPVQPHCRLQIYKDGRPTPADLETVQCRLEIVPQLTDDGRIRLQFTPHVQHGARAVTFAARQDPSGALRWDRHEDQPDETYSQAGWELTVIPNEFVLVGTSLKRPGTLGQACFLGGVDDDAPVQRLLVVRANRTLAELVPTDVPLGPSPPLALRASMTTFRGKAE
jgi:hypothetical protein